MSECSRTTGSDLVPKVFVAFDPETGEYLFGTRSVFGEHYKEYEATVEMKAATYKRLVRNLKRFADDQNILERLFIEAQMAGREIREQ